MFTFDQACEIVRQKYVDPLKDDDIVVDDEKGLEDSRDFLVDWGHRRWIEDGDDAFMLVDNTVTFVDKRTGVARQETASENIGRIAHMNTVSA